MKIRFKLLSIMSCFLAFMACEPEQTASTSGTGPDGIDRTVLPIKEPERVRYSELDVRNATEYATGHLPGSLHIPVGYLPERLAEIPRDKPIVVQCQSGARSAIATSLLQKLGVSNVTDLLGGFVAWESAGHEVQRDAQAAVV